MTYIIIRKAIGWRIWYLLCTIHDGIPIPLHSTAYYRTLGAAQKAVAELTMA